MDDPPKPAAGRSGQMRELGCIGLVFAGGMLLLALAAVAPNYSLETAFSPPPTGSIIIATLPASLPAEVRPITGKILPATPSTITAPVIPNEIDRRPVPVGADEALRHLMTEPMPSQDYFDSVRRLGGLDPGQRQIEPQPLMVGDRQTFQTADGPRQADLVHLTDYAAYWVETGLQLDREAITVAAQTVESYYLPPMQATFGREWLPGVDQESRITILHVLGSPDDYELGYFSDENEYPQSLFIHSNEREMVYLNMSRLDIGTDLYFGTLLHELQHLSQWNMDANEQVWLNEGLSQLAETMAGLDTVDASAYLARPDIRVDRWSSAASEVYAHYAGSYLYLLYLWQRAGEQAVRELVRHPANGLGGVQAVLEGHLPGVSLAQFSTDWAVANYLDSQGGFGPYAYDRVDLQPPALSTRARRLPFSTLNELEQMAVDYVDLDLVGSVHITFVGDTVASLTDGPPPSGELFWYAAPDNSSQATLTAAFDVPAAAGAELTFDTWYDLESNWDYAYLSVSADGGITWQVLPGKVTVTGQFGPAWNGRSTETPGNQEGWISETVSLAAFAGQSILLRFDLLSDFEGPSRGLAVANAQIANPSAAPQPLVWQAMGFTETSWLLPQEWGVRLIREGEEVEVMRLTPDASGMAQLGVVLGPEGGAVVVMPLTPPAAEPARYWLSVEPLTVDSAGDN